MAGLLQFVRRAAFSQAAEHSDGELLDCFLLRHEPAAFELLLRRHGPMVLGVCRRVLRNESDAEDAFQATFLVLLRRAGSIANRDVLGSWLYSVAYRTALRARLAAARRRNGEREAMAHNPPDVQPPQDDLLDLLPILDQHIHRLPRKYRDAVVLCDLQGKSRYEAARLLGLPEGTLSSRLARGRACLRRRLTRCGAVPAVAAVTGLLAREAAGAVPARLLTATAQMAASPAGLPAHVALLADQVVKGMLLARLQIGALVLLVAGIAGLAAGFGALTAPAPAPQPAAPRVVARALAPAPKPAPAPAPAVDPDAPDGEEAGIEEPEEPRITPPPAWLSCDPFYRKYLNAGGLPVLGSAKVSDRALIEAAYVVNGVFAARDSLRRALIDADVRIVVLHTTEGITDLPEKRHLRPKARWDSRVRWSAGRITCSGEENLLQLSSDRFPGQNLLVHELAHSVHSQALPRTDPTFDRRLQRLYRAAMARGLWEGTLAARNPREYWAEAVQCYFHCNGTGTSPDSLLARVNSRAGLKAHDPDIHDLIKVVFGDNPWTYQPPTQRGR
jgi:RNA polymerase sigma factor (sigma-70 family)